MSDEDRYRRHARFCREQASLLRGPERERWVHLADEYERWRTPNALYTKQQQQPPQSKADDEK